MQFIRNFFSGIFSFFFVLCLALLISLLSFTNVFLSKEVFLSTLEKNQTYSRIANEVLPHFLLLIILRGDQAGAYQDSDVEKIVANIPPQKLDSMKAQIKNIFEDGYKYILGESNAFEAKIELASSVASIKDSLAASVAKLNQSGEVTAITPAQINQGLATDQSYTLLLSQDKTVLVGPDGERLDNTNNKPDNNQMSLQNLRKAVESARQTQTLFLIASIVLGLVLFLSRLPNWVEGFKWVAGGFFSAGLFPLIMSFILLAIKPIGYVERFLVNHPELSIPKPVSSLLTLNLADLLNLFLEQLRLYSAILVISAIVIYILIWLGRFLTRKSQAKPLDTEAAKT